MPNRILREGILESERIHKIGPMAELFYRRLMSIVDDYGRYAYDIPVLLSRCFPRRPEWADAETISLWAGECREAGLLILYEVNKHKYLEVSDFRQPIRSKSKWPDPASQMSSICVADVEQMKTDIASSVSAPHTNTHTNTNGSKSENGEDLLTKRGEEFWALMWPRTPQAQPKKPALEIYGRKVTTQDQHLEVLAALKRQRPIEMAKAGEYRVQATTWLRQERWKDSQPPEPTIASAATKPAYAKCDTCWDTGILSITESGVAFCPCGAPHDPIFDQEGAGSEIAH